MKVELKTVALAMREARINEVEALRAMEKITDRMVADITRSALRTISQEVNRACQDAYDADGLTD